MAFCVNCGAPMADAAPSCPNCGHPNEALAAGAPVAQTPALGGVLAGFWQRFAARLLDAIIVGVVTYALHPGLGLVLGFVYYWLMDGLNDGRTVGKLALGIRVAYPDGSKISLGTAAAREAMAIVSGLALLIGFIWAAFDEQRRTWHDLVANTRVFKTGAA
jgi:uncharacterized RDD family membrane protein YckC